MKKHIEKSDFGTSHRLKDHIYKDQHIGITSGSKKRRRILSQSIIDRYYYRKLISQRQYDVAIYIYNLYHKSQKKVTGSIEPRVDGSSVNSGENQYIAFSDYIKIMKHFDRETFNIIQWIVIEGLTASEVDNSIYNKKRTTMLLLKSALDSLADHLRIK